jgi:hypothetical protein
MICGAEACNLGAMIHGVELRVHFLKSFQKGSICENLSQKGLKRKKDGQRSSAPAENREMLKGPAPSNNLSGGKSLF